MRFRVDPYELRENLLEHFRESGCLAVKEGRDIIDAHLLNSVSDRHDREVMDAYVLAWQEAAPAGAGRAPVALKTPLALGMIGVLRPPVE